MASGPITSRQIERKKVETVTDFFLAPKSLQTVTAAMELKDSCPLEEKAKTNLDSILKSRDITLLTKIHIAIAMIFPVFTYRCESWTVKKAEHQKTDAFELLQETLESPLDCREIKPVNSKGDQP